MKRKITITRLLILAAVASTAVACATPYNILAGIGKGSVIGLRNIAFYDFTGSAAQQTDECAIEANADAALISAMEMGGMSIANRDQAPTRLI